MQRRSRVSFASLALCVLLVLLAFLSMALVGSHMPHDCHRDDCSICALCIRTLTMQRFLSLLAAGMGAALLALLAAHRRATHRADRPKATSLITLRTRLNP